VTSGKALAQPLNGSPSESSTGTKENDPLMLYFTQVALS